MRRNDPAVLWATLFGVGFVRWAPGTFGSLAAVVIWWVLLAELPWSIQLGVVFIYSLLSTVIIERAMRRFGVKDAPEFVADEVAGMWLALLAAPHVWWAALGGFALFRLFDIAKPWPVGWLDRNVSGGLGVMADDLAAGVLSLAVLQISVFLVQAAV